MKHIIRLNETDLHRIVTNVLNEISDKMLARALVGTNVDLKNLNTDDSDLATNKNGQPVHRATQKQRRDRQYLAFRNALGQKLARKFGHDVKVSPDTFGGGEGSYYGHIGDNDDVIYHHYAQVNGDKPTSRYHTRDAAQIGRPGYIIPIRQKDLRSADYLTNLLDGMAGYHDELTGGKAFEKNIQDLKDRADDVNNLNKYRQDIKDYEKRKSERESEIQTFNRKPWYKKLGKKAPESFKEKKPEAPKIKTGSYFMPDNTEGLYKQIEQTKKNREANRKAYNNFLK